MTLNNKLNKLSGWQAMTKEVQNITGNPDAMPDLDQLSSALAEGHGCIEVSARISKDGKPHLVDIPTDVASVILGIEDIAEETGELIGKGVKKTWSVMKSFGKGFVDTVDKKEDRKDVTTCPYCASSVPPDSNFCASCGKKLQSLNKTGSPCATT